MIKKKSYFALLLLLFSCTSNEEWHEQMIINDVTEADFDDPKLYQYMQVNYDKNDDKIFQKNEILAVKSLFIMERVYPKNLKGLEKFVALEKLEVEWLKTDDSIKITNPRLRNLTISGGWISALDISELYEIQTFTYRAGIETPIDISNNEKLKELTCGEQVLLDLTNNPEIEKLTCQGIRIDSIDLSKCTKLLHLNMEFAKLKSLDISKNTKLEHLNMQNAELDSLDVSNCINLTYLNLDSRDISKPINMSKNKNLEEIFVNGSFYVNLDITQNQKVKYIYLRDTYTNPLIIFISKNQTKPEVETRSGNVSYEFQYK